MATPRLLTPEEAGEILRCSGETIKRYVRSGELRAFRHRGRVLIPEPAIERFVSEHLTDELVVRGSSGSPRSRPPWAPFNGERRLVEFD
jgi:excisionase family DNA binding protein